MSVRSSMYRMVFLMILLPFLLFSLLISQIYAARLEKVITESLSVVADAQVREMTDFCDYQREYLSTTGAMDLSRAAMRGELEGEMLSYLDNMLYSRVKMMGYLGSIAIIDREHRVVACSEAYQPLAGAEVSGIIGGMGDRPFYISDLLLDKDGQKTLVAMARIEEGGETLGYALAEISLDFYQDMRERAELWNGSTFYLLDGRQQIISAGTPEERREDFVTTAGERADYHRSYSAVDFEANPEGSFRYKIGGRDYITYYSGVEYTDWRVMLSVDMSGYQAQKAVYYILALFLAAVCAVLAVWVGRFASTRIMRPIGNISGTLKAIRQEEDYSLRVAVGRRDELGNLAAEVNDLLGFIETEDLYKTQQQRLLQEKAEQDALTKVMNKERIHKHLEEAVLRCCASGAPLAVLFVDVDNFKDFNDSYGHSVGDQVLLFLSSLLARGTGGAVGRVGGDEFLAVVEDPESIRALDQRLALLEEAAESRFVVRGSGTHLAISCCIGAVRADFSAPAARDLTPEELVERADLGMYQVKNSGKQGHLIVDLGM